MAMHFPIMSHMQRKYNSIFHLIANPEERLRNDEKSHAGSKYFVRPVGQKRSKWVYNFAKLCYTKKKFLTFGRRKMDFRGVRIDLKQNFNTISQRGGSAATAFRCMLKSFFVVPASEVMRLPSVFMEKGK